MSAPRSLLKGATVFLVLLSATASVGLAPAQAQRLTWDDFITSQRTLPVNGVPRGQKKPPRPGQPPLGAPNKPPPPSKPPPGPGPQPPPPLGLIPTCSGLATDPCVVPAGVQVNLTRSLTVRSLIIYGELLVSPPRPSRASRRLRQPQALVINSAFILVRGKGAKFSISGTDWDRTVTIYLRRDPSAYDDVPSDTQDMLGGGRALAAWQGGQVLLDGLPLQRTWTLLTQDTFEKDTTICVSDSVNDWPIGSTIAIASSDDVFDILPTELSTRVGAQTFKITGVQPAAGTACCRPDLPSTCQGAQISLNGSIVKSPPPPGSSPTDYSGLPVFHGSYPPVQAEVLMLNRTILITGDDISPRYQPNPPPPWKNPARADGVWPTPWSPWANSPYPTEGLHVLAAGLCDDGGVNGANCQSNGGFLKARYIRVEKGGQRGFIGRYPLHFHKMGNCPACEIIGNAVVGSTQRGIVIHSTHQSTVSRNVVFGVKGAFIYVEEGVEIDNTIQENALACDIGIASYTAFVNGTWQDAGLAPSADDGGAGKVRNGGGWCQANSELDFGDPSVQLGGCRIQGTDNEQADCVQQAGIWALSVSNNFIGNRVSNMYNGIYFQSTLFRDGRLGTDSLGRVCPLHSNWGVMRGNVVHSNERFGWYPDVNYPNAVKRSVDSNGYVTDLNAQCTDDLTDLTADAVCSCRPYTLPNGDSNGQPDVAYEDGIDWGNGFVGQYDLADVQYKNFTAINNNIGMYWKGSRNFRTVGTAHIKDSTFQYNTRPQLDYRCCGCSQPCFCPPPAPSYWLSYASYAGHTGTSLVQLPGASATMILENVQLLGSPGVAEWLPPSANYSDPTNTWVPGSAGAKYPGPGKGWRNGGNGAALAINQQCKFFKGFVNPLGDLGYDEGALCTPQVYLINVTFNIMECKTALAPDQASLPVWINIGAANGNSYLGMVLAADDSLCGGLMAPCPIRAVVSNYSTHLLDLPGGPCLVPDYFNNSAEWGADWFRRFNGHMICTKQTRRLNIWGQEQDAAMLLMPPGGARPWEMHWLGFGIAPTNTSSGCWGTQCSKAEERRWAEGYGATVMSNEELPGVWTLTRMDQQPIDLSKVRMIEFSDQVFGQRFQPVDTLLLQIDDHPVCTLRSTESRAWMTQFGPVQRGGGSCLTLLQEFPMAEA